MNQSPNFQLAENPGGRGFQHVYFNDAYDSICDLSESSVVGDYEDAFERPGSSAVWVGVVTPGPDLSADPDQLRMHLSRDHVRCLVDHLERWLETGRLV